MGFDRKAYMKKYNAKYRKENKEKLTEYNLKYKKDNSTELKEKRTEYEKLEHVKKLKIARKLRQRYGITAIQYDEMLKRQRYKCNICGKPHTEDKRLSVDHDHKSNNVRGLLCGDCNRGIGMFKDNINNLYKAINYLKKYGKQTNN